MAWGYRRKHLSNSHRQVHPPCLSWHLTNLQFQLYSKLYLITFPHTHTHTHTQKHTYVNTWLTWHHTVVELQWQSSENQKTELLKHDIYFSRRPPLVSECAMCIVQNRNGFQWIYIVIILSGFSSVFPYLIKRDDNPSGSLKKWGWKGRVVERENLVIGQWSLGV